MSSVISTTNYKNYQILVEETAVGFFSYEINDPILIKTVKRVKNFTLASSALTQAEAAIDAFPVTLATTIIKNALSGDAGMANTIILAILNASLTVVSTATPDVDTTNNLWGNNEEEHDQ
jgi:hypothetical protein